jgi:hypothetical protein
MNEVGVDPKLPERGARALKISLLLAGLAILLALILLIKETAYTFVLFMFVGPPLLVVAGLSLGWVIYTELRARHVL